MASPLPSQLILHDLIKSPEDESLILGCLIIIVPSGRKATVVGSDPNLDEETKTAVTERLAIQTIHVSKTAQWLRLRLLDANEPCLFVWPANLCVWDPESRQNPDTSSSIANILNEGPRADPFVRAEEWYAGRVERVTALAALRKKAQNDLQAQDGDSVSDDSEDFDRLGHFGNSAIIQDLTNVYPTPPDGPPFHTSPASNLPQLDGQASTGDAALDQSIPLGRSLANVPPGADHGLVNLGHRGSESLFGDMDTDLFESNGLTEADFNFFDEPDLVEDGHPRTAQRSENSTMASLTREPSAVEEEAIPLDEIADPPQHILNDPMHEAETSNAEGAEVESVGASDPISQQEMEPAKPLNSPSPVAAARSQETPNDRLHAQNLMENEKQGYHVPVKSSVDAVDAKYSDQGRFRFEQLVEIEGTSPSKESHSQLQEVPWIGTRLGTEMTVREQNAISSTEGARHESPNTWYADKYQHRMTSPKTAERPLISKSKQPQGSEEKPYRLLDANESLNRRMLGRTQLHQLTRAPTIVHPMRMRERLYPFRRQSCLHLVLHRVLSTWSRLLSFRQQDHIARGISMARVSFASLRS